MNKNLRKIYVAILYDDVIAFDTNFTKLYRKLKEMYPEMKSYSHYIEEIRGKDKIIFKNDDGFEITIQKLVP